MSRLRFSSLKDASRALAILRTAGTAGVAEGSWSAARTLHHCAASIECSVKGFPATKPWPVRFLARHVVLPKFLRQGFMHHQVDAPVPGLDEGQPGEALEPALDRVEAAIAAFASAEELAPHGVFGAMEREVYARYHAMHLADHLSAFTVEGRPFTP